jgi:hypothetical protein
VVLKAGIHGVTETSGFFYPVDFPPLTQGTPISGAQEYEENIRDGSDMTIYVGDILLVEPGNMVGPTSQGVNYLIDLDPSAYWQSDGTYQTNGGYVAGSAYDGEFASPRIIKIPMYDPDYPPSSGRNTVDVVRLGAFFLESIQGRNVMGRFIQITDSGSGGNSNSMIKGVSLIK